MVNELKANLDDLVNRTKLTRKEVLDGIIAYWRQEQIAKKRRDSLTAARKDFDDPEDLVTRAFVSFRGR